MIVFELHIYYITLKFIFPYWVISHIQDRSVICYVYIYDSVYVHDKHPVKWKTILLWTEFFITDRLLFFFFFLFFQWFKVILDLFMPGAHDRSKQWIQIHLGIFLKELNCGFYLQPCCDFYFRKIKIPLPTSACAHQYSVTEEF